MAIFPGSAIPSAAADAYEIDNSCRFEDGDSATLNRTFSAGNQQVFTVSSWVKLGNVGTGEQTVGLLGEWEDIDNRSYITFGSYCRVLSEDSGSDVGNYQTDAVFRDPSAWYHVVFSIDVTQAVAADRVKIYVNGVEEDVTISTNWAEDTNTRFNAAREYFIGKIVGGGGSSVYADGYLAEYYFIDGTAYDADDFGELSSTTNQWIPLDSDDVKDAVTFGTNGFYQKYGATELANSFTDSADHSIHTISIQGSVHTDTTTKKIGTASAEFDGTDDYLTVSDASDFSFGTGDFTIECWWRRDAYPSRYLWDFSDGTSRITGHISNDGAGTRVNWFGTGWSNTTEDLDSGGLDIWNHLALVRDNGVGRWYVNGVQKNTLSSWTTDFGGTWVSRIGAKYTSNTDDDNWSGFIDEVRVSSVCRYPDGTTFTDFGQGGGTVSSPTAFTADSSTKLLLHMDGSDSGTTFTDDSSTDASRHYITANGDVTNTRAEKKIGDSSIKFDGTGDYLSMPDSSDWQLGGGTGNFTIEGWVYVNTLVGMKFIYAQWADTNNRVQLYHSSTTGRIYFDARSSGVPLAESYTTVGITAETWHHIAVVRETTSITIYIDGVAVAQVEYTAVGTNSMPDLAVPAMIGDRAGSGVEWAGYMDEIRISDTARYTTTFTPSTTAFTADSNTKLLIHSDWDGGLGADSSGNGNAFAVTNLVATDQMIDTPTNNFATLNPIIGDDGTTNVTFAEGNLKYSNTDGTYRRYAPSTINMPSGTGKYYCEGIYTTSASSTYDCFGIGNAQLLGDGKYGGSNVAGIWAYRRNGNADTEATGGTSGESYGATWATGDIIGIAYDSDAGAVTFYKNNATQGELVSGITDDVCFFVAGYNTCDAYFNFGSDSSFAGNKTAQGNQDANEKGDFYYEPPTDYLALCTSNLASPEIALPGDYFNTILYDDGAGAKTGVGFQPDFVWLKSRGSAYDSKLTDVVRGVTKALVSNDPGTAQTTDSTGLTAFGADGFTVGADTDYSDTTGTGMVAWNWKAGGTGVTNTAGDIAGTVTVSANTTAGFSIVGWTGSGSVNTVGHGLSEAPELIIAKRLDSSAAFRVGSDSIPTAWEYVMYLNQTPAAGDDNVQFNDTAPTASVFTLGTGTDINASGVDIIAWCFHSVEGYSKIGNYEGNGDLDGTFVYTGFRPAFVMTKSVDSTSDWQMFDNKRVGYNVDNYELEANDSAVEDTSTEFIDIVSNGFKNRDTTDPNVAETYLYIAFAESPFKYSNAR